MAELADALDLGSSGVTRTGSIPASCTKGYHHAKVKQLHWHVKRKKWIQTKN